MAETGKRRSELRKVVDLAVLHYRNRFIFVVLRLVAAPHIDNAESTHCQADMLIDVQPFIIRAAMSQSIAHATQIVTFDGPVVEMNYSDDSAHCSSLC
jgi:hypothetical protein